MASPTPSFASEMRCDHLDPDITGELPREPGVAFVLRLRDALLITSTRTYRPFATRDGALAEATQDGLELRRVPHPESLFADQ